MLATIFSKDNHVQLNDIILDKVQNLVEGERGHEKRKLKRVDRIVLLENFKLEIHYEYEIYLDDGYGGSMNDAEDSITLRFEIDE